MSASCTTRTKNVMASASAIYDRMQAYKGDVTRPDKGSESPCRKRRPDRAPISENTRIDELEPQLKEAKDLHEAAKQQLRQFHEETYRALEEADAESAQALKEFEKVINEAMLCMAEGR